MKYLFTVMAAATFAFSAQAQFPYNPDADGDELITVDDLIIFLPTFGSQFQINEILAVENGGTGADNPLGARMNLGLGLFEDNIININGMDEPFGWVSGGLRFTGAGAFGFDPISTGDYSIASGYNSAATGNFSNATNRFTVASGICSHAEGEGSEALGTAAHAEGMATTADGTGAHSEGNNTSALALAAHAEGNNTQALAVYAHSQGQLTVASGGCSHAEGEQTTASALAAHAEGFQTEATADYSHAGGQGTIADQVAMTAIGKYNNSGQSGTLFAVGYGSSDFNRLDAFRVLDNGKSVFASDVTVNGNIFLQGTNVLTELTALQDLTILLQNQIGNLQAQIDDLQFQIDNLGIGE